MQNGNFSDAIVLASIVFFSMVFFIIPDIAYVFIASFNRTNECSEYTTLLTWLLLIATFELFSMTICFIKIIWDYFTISVKVSHALKNFFCFLWFISGFNMAACAIGLKWILEYDECYTEKATIYYTAWIAVISGYLEIVSAMIFIMFYK